MRAVVLSIGSEILRGDIVDTNACYLARQLSQLGFDVACVEAVGDSMESLTAGLRDALQRGDVVIGTGGLGPTEDDLTRQAIAMILGEEPVVDEEIVAEIHARFHDMGRPMPTSNRQQALVIPSAQVISNPHGTAPGWLVRRDGRIIAAMPGPPHEMEAMWATSVRPVLETLLPGQIAMRSLMTFGLGESAVEERVADAIHWHEHVTIATYAKSNGIQIHITARGGSAQQAEDLATDAEEMVRDRLGDVVFGIGDGTLAEVVGVLLRERGHTLAVMESCTGGLLGSLITSVSGSSDYFAGGIIAYTGAAKVRYGVDRGVIERHGIVSEETAKAMADAACDALGTDAGVGVTGVAGDDAIEGHPPGTCYIAARVGGVVSARELHRPGQRDVAKHFFAQSALDLLRRILIHESSSP